MDTEEKPQLPADKKSTDNKPSEPKPQQGVNNLLWYMLGGGILLLLVASVWNSGNEESIRWSEFIQLVEASDSSMAENEGILVVDAGTKDRPRTVRLSQLAKVVIGEGEVTATITREVAKEEEKTAISSETTENPAAVSSKTTEPIVREYEEKEEEVVLRIARDREEKVLAGKLKEHGVPFRYSDGPSAWEQYLPLFMLMGLFAFLFIMMMRKMGGAGSPMAFGRSRGKLLSEEDIEASFEDVAGIDEAVEELQEVVDFLQTPEKFQVLGGRIPKGVLLVGPPGTGKTLLAKAIAGEAGVPFFSLSGSDFVEMFVGVGAARVRDMFQQAAQCAPCIIFIDELDALGKTRGSGQVGGHDEREQTLNALLVEMDGFGTNSGVIVIGATNRPETLDPALLRPGRFDRHVLVDRPDVVGREKILNVHLKQIKTDEHVDAKSLASITSGFVGADLANIVNEAALLAARQGKKVVTMDELQEAVERNAAGLEKKSRIIQEDEKIRVAYHESGHALVAYSLPNTDPVHKVSIIPRGLAALGYMMQRPEEDRYLMTQSELESRIQVMLAGTITEEMIFDDISTGAQNDLERATSVARSMVMEYGMSRLGRVNYRESNRSAFIAGGDMPAPQHHSEQTAREIDEEVKRILDESLEKARAILERRKDALVAVSKALLEHEVIDGNQLKELVEEHSPGPMIAAGTDVERKASKTPLVQDSPENDVLKEEKKAAGGGEGE